MYNNDFITWFNLLRTREKFGSSVSTKRFWSLKDLLKKEKKQKQQPKKTPYIKLEEKVSITLHSSLTSVVLSLIYKIRLFLYVEHIKNVKILEFQRTFCLICTYIKPTRTHHHYFLIFRAIILGCFPLSADKIQVSHSCYQLGDQMKLNYQMKVKDTLLLFWFCRRNGQKNPHELISRGAAEEKLV